MDEIAITWIDPNDLIPHPLNPKSHPPKKIEEIRASIRRRGYTQPIVVGNTPRPNTILAGHARREASLLEGLDRVPIIDKSDLPAAEQEMYVIADNRLNEGSTWDHTKLVEMFDHIEDEHGLGDMDATGFDAGDRRKIRAELARAVLMAKGAQEGEDNEPRDPLTVWVQPGDLFTLGPHRILCGDSENETDVARLFDGDRPTLMVTDPPYGVNYDPKWREKAGLVTTGSSEKMGEVANDHRASWLEAYRHFPGDVCYVWHAATGSAIVESDLHQLGFETRAQIIWVKDRFALSRGHYHWQHECCWYMVRKDAKSHWIGDRKQATTWKIDTVKPADDSQDPPQGPQSTVWEIAAREDHGHGHSTQKPVECMRRPILNNSVGGDLVYDPFLGSGTTVIACDQTDRICFGMELKPAYIQIAIDRFVALREGEVVHQATGKTWRELRELRLGLANTPASTAH